MTFSFPPSDSFTKQDRSRLSRKDVDVGSMILLADARTFWAGVVNILLLVIGIFLILVVLIQRGKGGGLSGAFGGAGGSSAFGSRAGDLFTKITLVVAGIWLGL